MLRSFVNFPALLHLRHSYASRSADFAAPHLVIMPQLNIDALHVSASVLRIMLASLAGRCTSYPRNAAASRVQHCLRRHSLLILSLSYNLNTTCAAGATEAPSTGRKPGFWVHRVLNFHYANANHPI